MLKEINVILLFSLLIFLLFNILKKKEMFTGVNNGIDTFDKYFYINLEHRKDRNNQITNEFKKIKLNKNKIIRIDAVRNKLNGHIGCAKSHIKALKLAKKMKLKHVIIFEDDFIFTLSRNEIDAKLNMFLKYYKNNWDVIQLTTVHKKITDLDNKQLNNHFKKVNNATTSSAYIIQSHFYNKLLNDLSNSVEKMEKEMTEWEKKNKGEKKKTTNYALDQHWGKLQNNSKWYIFSPYIGKQGGEAGGSSIMGGIESFFNYIQPARFYSVQI